MKEIFVQDNIYNKQGGLLVAKGSRITMDEQSKRRYAALGVLDQIYANERQDARLTVQEMLENLNNRSFQISSSNILSDATDILQDVLNDGKKVNIKVFLDLLRKVDLAWIYSHSINTTLLSVMAGLAFKYNESDLYDLAKNTIIHDIGMAMVPDEILNSTQALSDEDYKTIQKHCVFGKGIVDKLSAQFSTDIIMEHHERLDGSGYPYGVGGRNICHGAQIVSVADALDSATTDRPYRPAKSINTVFNELARCTGQYSEEVLMIFKMMFK